MQTVFLSLYFICSELTYITTSLCNKDPDLTFLLNRFVYSLVTAMSSVTGNHTMDLFYLLKESDKNLLYGSLISGRSYESLPYLASCFLSQRWRFQKICSNVLQDIESDLAYTKGLGGVSHTFYGLEACCIHWAVAFLRINEFFCC